MPKASLQFGGKPIEEETISDPQAPLGPVIYHRAQKQQQGTGLKLAEKESSTKLSESQKLAELRARKNRSNAQKQTEEPVYCTGPMPAETYQYDLVYEAFKNDKIFWDNWKILDCARNSPENTEMRHSQDASIRVVMNLPPTQRLYPTAYTPGFPTVPLTATQRSVQKPDPINGLPPGYSVALDVHVLDDAKVMLMHQRKFRGGSIDPKYDWLDKILRAHEAKNTEPYKESAGSRIAMGSPSFSRTDPTKRGRDTNPDFYAQLLLKGDHEQEKKEFRENVLVQVRSSEPGLPLFDSGPRSLQAQKKHTPHLSEEEAARLEENLLRVTSKRR